MLEGMCVCPTSSLSLEGGQAPFSVVLSLNTPPLFPPSFLPFTHPHCNRFLMHLLIPTLLRPTPHTHKPTASPKPATLPCPG